MTAPFFIGIDIGTQGVRIVMIDVTGNVVATAEENFPLSSQSRQEQSPHEWWSACMRCLKKVIQQARAAIDIRDIKAVSVTSTSGTVIPLDRLNEPVHNAIMYSDNRSAEEGVLCRQLAMQFNPSAYTGFNSSSGLSKMVWFGNHFPEKAAQVHKWIHATDFIIGKLSGKWGITDYTNVLKSGYDLQHLLWPEYLYEHLPLKKEWLPAVLPSGCAIGSIEPSLAKELGLEPGIVVTAGMTDGCASQVASGAVNPGDWNTTIGTTLVVKGVTSSEIKDPEDRVYNHRHPDGFWMPGGAGNIGADWVSNDFKEDLHRLEEQAKQLIPTGKLCYPLRQQGERFPFIAPEARGFEPGGLSKPELFAANMEGVAYVERYAYEMIGRLSGEQVKAVFTAGGASNSDTWLTIRSNVLNLPVYKMKHVSGAIGAAILAASKTHFNSLQQAAQALTQIEKEIIPEPGLAERYDQIYKEFIHVLEEKGYIKNSNGVEKN